MLRGGGPAPAGGGRGAGGGGSGGHGVGGRERGGERWRREMLRGYASSPLGQGRVAALAPSGEQEWIERQQAMAEEIREYRRVGGRFDFSGLNDPSALVQKARIEGAALEAGELREILAVV